eukprot:gene10342-biopygen8070
MLCACGTMLLYCLIRFIRRMSLLSAWRRDWRAPGHADEAISLRSTDAFVDVTCRGCGWAARAPAGAPERVPASPPTPVNHLSALSGPISLSARGAACFRIPCWGPCRRRRAHIAEGMRASLRRRDVVQRRVELVHLRGPRIRRSWEHSPGRAGASIPHDFDEMHGMCLSELKPRREMKGLKTCERALTHLDRVLVGIREHGELPGSLPRENALVAHGDALLPLQGALQLLPAHPEPRLADEHPVAADLILDLDDEPRGDEAPRALRAPRPPGRRQHRLLARVAPAVGADAREPVPASPPTLSN